MVSAQCKRNLSDGEFNFLRESIFKNRLILPGVAMLDENLRLQSKKNNPILSQVYYV